MTLAGNYGVLLQRIEEEGLGSAAKRFVQTKLAMLKRREAQHPFYWASFIQSGEWASLDGKRD